MKVWIFLNGTQQGPFELKELLDMPVNENTKVWFEGLPKWYPAGSLAEMRPLFDGTLSRLPVPPPTPSDFRPEASTAVDRSREDDEPGAVEETLTVEEQQVTEEENVKIESAESWTATGYAPTPPATPRMPQQPCPPSYLVWGIVLTICCCSPLAVGVIIASVMVGSNYARGNYAGAERASQWAQWLIMITLALGIIPTLLLALIL